MELVAINNETSLVPLRSWIKNEANKASSTDPQKRNSSNLSKESIVCQTTVAYGIVELLLLREKNHANASAKNNRQCLEEEIQIDNFAVCVCMNNNSKSSRRPWEDINGISMLSSGMHVSIYEPSYLNSLNPEGEEEYDGQVSMGRFLEVDLISPPPDIATIAAADKAAGYKATVAETDRRLSLLTRVLYELFCHEPFVDDALLSYDEDCSKEDETSKSDHRVPPPRKKLMLSRAHADFDEPNSTKQIPHLVHMQKRGLPASLCLMMQNLLECDCLGDCGQQSGDAYTSLDVVAKDLHLLLFDPDRFLFDKEVNVDTSDNMQLLYKKEKMYGRDIEESLITDAFCRVSSGTSEAFFVGGFSGSGKSMLVNSLRSRVNAVGGYVIKHKFDVMSQKKPFWGVIAAFNQICQIIKDGSTHQGLAVIAKQLLGEFGADFSLLMRLLPNVSLLSHEFASPAIEVEAVEAMNAHSVCFILLRFVRVVSSPRHPVMLVLDDLQWADDTALEVVHTILSDTMGSCMLFVGAYRDNEVQMGHAIFDLMEKLEISNVRTTKVFLTGLDQEDLNTMISDALCLYPRICKSLSDIVFQKTKGSPFFALEFMQSLRSRGLLQYNFNQKRWVWNENIIRTEEITDNVLHLLSSKMKGLPDDVQTLLKVMACLGTSMNKSVIGYLSKSSECIEDSLKKAINDGFVEDDGAGSFKFVHDKVRETAYNLISDDVKQQFHYNLGIVLHSNCEGNEGDAIFLIASQINHGKESIMKNRELCITVATLNMKAGKRALDGCSPNTAYSYLSTSSTFMPEDHWESYHDLSLRLSFLMASAAYSCCNYEEAELILRGVFEKALSVEEKLPAYSLLSTIFQTQGRVVDAYNTFSCILTQLGETIPESVSPEAATGMITETVNMFEEIYDDEWKRTNMEDETLRATVQFYCGMALAAYFFKPRTIVTWYTCRAVQLCLRKGMCKHCPIALVQLTVLALNRDNIPCMFRLGNEAISLLESFNLAGQISDCYYYFYAGVAWHVEPLQSCSDKLIEAFSSGLSNGNTNSGFYSLFQAYYLYVFCGKNLSSLLVEIDYYLRFLTTYKNEVAKNYLLGTRETVSMLVDKGHATSIEAKASYGDVDNRKNKQREMFFFHQAIRCFWLGYFERSKHFCEKCLQLFGHLPQFNTCQIKFYHGLHLIRTQMQKKSKESVRLAIAEMRDAASKSDWNFKNKLELLEAELYSFEKKHDQAIGSYDASIASAHNSKFIHEQGLACEKAGFHCKKMKDMTRALKYFRQARQCYEEWGSSMKVDFIQKELDCFDSQQTNLNKV